MQLLIAEMGLTETVDPLAGSFYVETMTNEMRAKMEEIMAEVDAQGGIVKMVAEGTIQAKVSAQAYGMQRKIDSGEFPKVGVNCYKNEQEEDHPVEFHPYNEDDARVQIESLKRIRAERDNAAVTAALARLRADAAAGTQRHAGPDGSRQGLRQRRRNDQGTGRRLRPLPGTDSVLTLNAFDRHSTIMNRPHRRQAIDRTSSTRPPSPPSRGVTKRLAPLDCDATHPVASRLSGTTK
jgi:hypothetical protein